MIACAPDAPPAPRTVPAPTAAAAAPFSGTDTNLTPQQLETLVGPVALYPDDLLAVVLPASTQPLQVVDAQRFLEQRKTNPSLQPRKTWDPSVVALLNYPEALTRMTSDLTWLQQLGTSVVNQQPAVMDAVQAFRKKALDAGNLKSNDKQSVSVQPDGSNASQTIVIESASPQVIYVPTYEPSTVVYAPPPYPSYPYYPYYWSAPYPYYYSPAAPFFMGTFVGVAIGFGCDWDDHDIYHGDIKVDNININREQARQRIEERRNSDLANQIRRNPENVWRPDPSGLSRAQAAGNGFTRSASQQPAAGSRNLGASASAGAGATALGGRASGDAASRPSDRTGGGGFSGNTSYGASSSGAFSGIDRGAAASRYSARGASSMSGGVRGGGFRGGGGRR